MKGNASFWISLLCLAISLFVFTVALINLITGKPSWALKKALENYEMAKKGTPIVRFNKETHKFEETGTFETNVRDANDALRLIVDLCGFTEKKVSIEGSLATSTIVQEDV